MSWNTGLLRMHSVMRARCAGDRCDSEDAPAPAPAAVELPRKCLDVRALRYWSRIAREPSSAPVDSSIEIMLPPTVASAPLPAAARPPSDSAALRPPGTGAGDRASDPRPAAAALSAPVARDLGGGDPAAGTTLLLLVQHVPMALCVRQRRVRGTAVLLAWSPDPVHSLKRAHKRMCEPRGTQAAHPWLGADDETAGAHDNGRTRRLGGGSVVDQRIPSRWA